MTWHSYRVVTDAGVMLLAFAMTAYCWRTPKHRPYMLGFALIACAAAAELVRETRWPTRGTIADLSFTLIDLVLVVTGLVIIMYRWRREH